MDIKSTVSKMTLKEKIYQTMIIHADEKFYSADSDFLKNYASEYPYGGVFVGEEIIGGAKATGETITNAIKNYNKFAKILPIVCADTENGCGYMFPDGKYSDFPKQMALGAARDSSLAYDYGKHTALAAKEIGINLALAPVADINMSFHNCVVNARAFSDKPEIVSDMVTEVVKGMQEYGLGATAKHFPGDGTDYRDQHFVLTNNVLSFKEWKKTFGKVYKNLIKQGVMSIMAGHIALPSYQTDLIDGIAPPATLSYDLITKLLKNEMGFDGVVMSDALCMNGFRSIYTGQLKSELECFKCGVDMMLWPCAGFADGLEKAILSGEIPESRLDDAVERILLMKERLGLIGEEKSFKTDSIDGINDIDTILSHKAITLIRDRRHVLPKKDIKRVSIIALTSYKDELDSLKCMISEFEKRGAEVFFHEQGVKDEIWEENLDLILYVTFGKHHKPIGPITISPSWQTLSHEREKAIAVALGSPYIPNMCLPTANMAIATYSHTKGCQTAVVEAIYGEIEFKGTMPVELPVI